MGIALQLAQRSIGIGGGARIKGAALGVWGGARYVGRYVGGSFRQHPVKSSLKAAGVFGTGLVGYGAYRVEQAVARAGEADQMARMILTAQSGPFGPSGRMMGISSNHNNTAGLTLAAHYARNRSKNFGVLGLRFL